MRSDHTLLMVLVALWLASALTGAHAADQIATPSNTKFKEFLDALWPDAQGEGVSRSSFDTAFSGITPDPDVIALTGRQPEYGAPAGSYIAAAASEARAQAGRLEASQWEKVLDEIETRFGVDRWTLLSVWGIEAGYGKVPLRWDVVRSLATLAAAGYRYPYFRNQLLLALKIGEANGIGRQKMMGSWAGAMGQPQFMPSSFLDYAVDMSGDGQSDIWTNVPDILGSMANYLQNMGWKKDLSWGYEVTIPKDFDYRQSRGSFPDWSGRGLRRATGDALPGGGGATLLFPSGVTGPAFLVTDNFVVLKRYNNSDLYALAVGELADRMQGFGPVRAAWPKEDHQLSRTERIGLQRKLAELGYPVHDFQGYIDFDLRDAIRDVQVKLGLIPDGQPTPQLLEKLKLNVP